MTNSADSDQLASSEANWSGCTLFAKIGHVVFSKRRFKISASMLKLIQFIQIKAIPTWKSALSRVNLHYLFTFVILFLPDKKCKI